MIATMRAVLVMAVAWVLGCEASVPIDRSKLVDGPPGWETAYLFACDEFGEVADRPPIYFYGPASHDCPMEEVKIAGKCRTGTTGANGILVVLPYDGVPPHETVMVHEIAHWYFGDGDHGDVRIWGEDYKDMWRAGTRVGDVNLALIEMGL
jgi:hypothetical protein